MTRINRNRTRTATLWLLDDSQFTIPEDDWPPCTHGDDDKAARCWARITGLPVTIETITNTTVKPDDPS